MGYFWAFIGLAIVFVVAFNGWNQHSCIDQRGTWDGNRCVFEAKP